MGQATETKETTAVVLRRDHALTGTLQEKHLAYQQIGAAMASLQLNGWKQMGHCVAAAWLADAAGMHPAIFIQNHYCMEIQGKLLVEPKWEFIVATLQSRVPGFRMKVLEETNDRARVRMEAPGYETQEQTYTVEDAKRQGLFSRAGGNMWTAGNTKEGCFKQVVKRCGRRFAPSALMDLPVSDTFEIDAEVSDASNVSGLNDAQRAIDAALDRAGAEGVHAEFEESAASPPAVEQEPAKTNGAAAPAAPSDPAETPRKRLERLIRRRYGNISKAVLADRVALIYNAMVQERTNANPGMKAGAKLGPLDVDAMCEYLERGTPDPTEPAAAVEEDVPPLFEQPPVEEEPAPDPVEQFPEETVVGAPAAYAQLQVTVGRARQLWGKEKDPSGKQADRWKRWFLQEYPVGSAKIWYTDSETLKEAGRTEPLLVSKDGAVAASQSAIEQMNAILAKLCDERERGGR